MRYGYARVSTKGQEKDGNSLESQREQLISEGVAADNIVMEAYSGAKERPLFNQLLERLEKGDTLVVTKLDRFCRKTLDGLEYINQLKEKGVKIHILNLGLIEDTAMGDLIVTCLLAFAEFERATIQERTSTGKAAARQKPGFKEGRPKKYTEKQLNHALELKNNDYSYNQVAELTGISKSTLIREMKKRRAAATK